MEITVNFQALFVYLFILSDFVGFLPVLATCHISYFLCYFGV